MLKEKERENGPLWSDEGMYHIAKEMQLLYPQKFSIIFLGIGSFHLKKGSHWLFGYVLRTKWYPKSVNQRKGLWTCICELSYECRKLYLG